MKLYKTGKLFMKSPRGFGKNYFTFGAILAYSVERTLQSQNTSLCSMIQYRMAKEEDEIDDPPEILEALITLTPTQPCHCNCFFKLKTQLMLLLYHYIPRCPFYTVCFAYRRTGVHPPLSLLN